MARGSCRAEGLKEQKEPAGRYGWPAAAVVPYLKAEVRNLEGQRCQS